MNITAVAAESGETCGYPSDEVMLASRAFIRTDQVRYCGEPAVSALITDDGARMACCNAHLAVAAKALRQAGR